MGDFFNEVVIFLEDYYVYVIGVGIIVILMLIGLLASKRKAKVSVSTEEPMANINDVNTGSINDVASTLQSDVMQPVDVVTFPGDNSPVTEIEPVQLEVAESMVSTPIVTPIEPIAGGIPSFVKPVEGNVVISGTDIVTPIVEDYKPATEVKTVADDQFDKTEIIDFSAFAPVTTPIAKEDTAIPFTVDNSQYSDTDSMLNGEDSSDGAPKI